MNLYGSATKKIVACILAAALSGCATVYNPATQKNEVIFINEKSEIELGKNISAETNKTNKLSKDPALIKRVNEVGARLIQQSSRPNLPYQFFILDSDEVNAMALPGGVIYVNKGLLDNYNDDELAFVIGHELAHVAAKHSVKQLQASIVFQSLLVVIFAAGGEKNSQTTQDIANISSTAYNLINLGYSRQDEYLADRLGTTYAYNAGYNADGAISALKKLEDPNLIKLKVLQYLKSHPDPEDRIREVTKQIQTLRSKEVR